ncbi:hypothetical protein SAMN05421785_101494 [Chryseobacterium gambrini]|uniref:Uncharacterized protein n=1 Tax=Chryseobacterium gambrini TaxID=373672 RepID=A0A1N7KHG9_9FLAO|nr:hypothetical protein SAMN05421785_101494 [Chryseobacterium gambrini]
MVKNNIEKTIEYYFLLLPKYFNKKIPKLFSGFSIASNYF